MSAKVIDWTAARIARGLAPPRPPGVPAYGSPPRNDDCIVHGWWCKVPITADYVFCLHCGLTSTAPQPLLPPRRRYRPQPLGPKGPQGGAG